jgi:hypothetical protein
MSNVMINLLYTSSLIHVVLDRTLFFCYPFSCALGYRTLCSTSRNCHCASQPLPSTFSFLYPFNYILPAPRSAGDRTLCDGSSAKTKSPGSNTRCAACSVVRVSWDWYARSLPVIVQFRLLPKSSFLLRRLCVRVALIVSMRRRQGPTLELP